MQVQFPSYIPTVNHFYRYRCEQISNSQHHSEYAIRSTKYWKILCKMHIETKKITQPQSERELVVIKLNDNLEFIAVILIHLLDADRKSILRNFRMTVLIWQSFQFFEWGFFGRNLNNNFPSSGYLRNYKSVNALHYHRFAGDASVCEWCSYERNQLNSMLLTVL